VRMFVAVLVGTGLFLSLPSFAEMRESWEVAYHTEAVVLLAALVAILYRIRHVGATAERRFWFLVAAAYAAYLSTFTFYADWDTPNGRLLGLLEDALHLSFYAAIFFAVVGNSHVTARGRLSTQLQRIESLGSIVFSFGLITYFVLIPAALHSGGAESYAPQIFVYVMLDLSIAISFVYLRKICDDRRWRMIYALFAASFAIWVVVDLAEALMWWEILPFPQNNLAELIWYLPHIPVVLAARARDYKGDSPLPEAESAGVPAVRQLGFGGHIVMFLAFFPVMHLGLYAVGILDARSQPAREICVLLTLFALGALAIQRLRRQEHERRQLEAQILQSHKMEAVGRLAGGIAHDFNNLLTVITGYSQMMLDRLGPNDPARADIENIASAGERAKALTTKLLAFSRGRPVRGQVVDLNEAVEAICHMLRRVLSEDIALRFYPATEPCPARIDWGQIEQVLLNVAVNAKDAMPDGGELVFTLGHDEVDQEGVFGAGTMRPGPYVVLSVRDNGSGMGEETLRHAFEPFFTTKTVRAGTGLGLSTAYGILRNHGGELVVASTRGIGTTVTIYLPLGDVSALQARTEPMPEASTVDGSEAILVVEDEEAVRDIVREILTHRGYRVWTAHDAEAAERLFEAEGDRVNLLLTDVVMPGKSGPELYRELSQRQPDLKVLFMTGYSPADLLNGEVSATDHPFITKPFEIGALCRRVRGILDGHPDR